MLKIYLDNCCYNRPYDDQSQVRISLETQAKLYIQNLIVKTGVKPKDAQHIASAIVAGCDHFLSTDDRLLKYKTNEITLMNPVDFIKNMEDEENDE